MKERHKVATATVKHCTYPNCKKVGVDTFFFLVLWYNEIHIFLFIQTFKLEGGVVRHIHSVHLNLPRVVAEPKETQVINIDTQNYGGGTYQLKL